MSDWSQDAGEALWDAADVARYLKASRSYVYKVAKAGVLPCLRIGAMLRFDPERVRAYARGRAHEIASVHRLEPRKR